MNIESVFHSRWALDATLEALLPAASVYTGRVPSNPTTPYASIQVRRMQTIERSNLSWFRECDILIRIIPTDYPEGKAIHDAVIDTFEDRAWAASDGAVEDIGHSVTSIDEGDQPDEPQWQFDVVLAALCREDRP